MRGRGREVWWFIQARYMRNRYMRVVKLLRRRVWDRLRQRLMKTHGLAAIHCRVIGHHLTDDSLRRRRRSGRLDRRFWMAKLIRYTVIMAVDDRPLLRFRRGTKGIFERSNESWLRRRRRTRRCTRAHRRGRGRDRGRSDRRRARRNRHYIFVSRRMNAVSQRRRFVDQIHVVKYPTAHR